MLKSSVENVPFVSVALFIFLHKKRFKYFENCAFCVNCAVCSIAPIWSSSAQRFQWFLIQTINVIPFVIDMILNMFNNDIDIWWYCIFWGKLWSNFVLGSCFLKKWAFFILWKWFLNYSKTHNQNFSMLIWHNWLLSPVEYAISRL